jgi:hypothetical protein
MFEDRMRALVGASSAYRPMSQRAAGAQAVHLLDPGCAGAGDSRDRILERGEPAAALWQMLGRIY